ncbi:lytic murein transglycosylase [Aestuariibacter halophilus]|uniref:Lytic murein transglycosylase n=1 Tax=Fluctibacter halophilus TaxID=226011 RepID=A0ABS8G6N7_9ALTE|nr:lytic murein transglycosylase [Aestuariibacter halophilus]MCC2616257.1 lytic murein transglycosylase [Aestuariibacter halophilus]
MVLLGASVHSIAQQPDPEGFDSYVNQLTQTAIEQGISPATIDAVLVDIHYIHRAVKADKNQPETRLTLDRYLKTRVPDWKVNAARQQWQQHRELLTTIGKAYGVQPRFIVALWGNESNFGKIQGNFPLFSSLATLAFDGRREAFFKQQWLAALRIVDEGHRSVDDMTGSWAGAMGQTQFMPTSFMHYAVDYDQDGRKDIWSTPADVFASIANYLASEGWNEDYTWGRQVKVPEDFDASLAGLNQDKMKPLTDWQAIGVTRYNGAPLPAVELKASLIMPDGPEGRIYLVYNNFHTLMKWNRSQYFGVSVSYLAEKIRQGA